MVILNLVVKMLIFSVDFSENSLLTEQLGYNSFNDLPIMNRTLAEHQARNFIDCEVDMVYLLNCACGVKLQYFDSCLINEKDIFKALALSDDSDLFVAYRNDVYFELDSIDVDFSSENELTCLNDNNGLIFLVCGTIGKLKTLSNKGVTLTEILKQPKRFTDKAQIIKNPYVKLLCSVKDYKTLLIDILNNKTNYTPPFVAEGIYTNSSVPMGDFSIIPPVYIGDNVQIESNSQVGPCAVILSNSLIAENTSIKNSILFENVFVSSNCFIDGSVCCDNASIKRNTAVFSESIIGSDALIGEDMILENGSVINSNVKYDKLSFISHKKYNFLNEDDTEGLFPDKVALMGIAFGKTFKKTKVVVGSDATNEALCLKLAFISGLIASGCVCFDIGVTFESQIYFSLSFCDCDYGVFFSGFNTEIFNSDYQPLGKTQFSNLFEACKNNEHNLNINEKTGTVRQIKGLRRMYLREISAFLNSELPLICNVFCKNPILQRVLEELFGRQDKNINNVISIYLNENGTNANINFKDKIYTQRELSRLVYFYHKKHNKDDIFDCDLFNRLWRCDSVVLIAAVLNIIALTGESIDYLLENLPQFFIKSDTLDLKCNDSEIAWKINKKFNINNRNGAFEIKTDKGYARVINDKNFERVRVLTASDNMAVSEELFTFFKALLED